MSVASSDIFSFATTADPVAPLSPYVMRYELFDPDVMKSMLEDENISSFDRKMLSRYYKARRNTNEVEVHYYFAKDYKDLNIGRIYPNKGIGLQSFSKVIRGPLTSKYYWDLDIINAHFHFATHVAAEYGIKHDAMSHYIANREECLAEVSSDKTVAKVAFLKVLYGGDISLYDPFLAIVPEPTGDLTQLVLIKKEVDSLMNNVFNDPKYAQIRRLCFKKRNPKASVLSIVLQDMEREALMHLDRFLTHNNRSMRILIHDGGNILKLKGESEFPPSLLKAAEEHLLESTGFELKLAIKPIVNNYEIKNTDSQHIEGIPLQSILDAKEKFEKDHFLLVDNMSICKIMPDNSLKMVHDKCNMIFDKVTIKVSKDNNIKFVPFVPIWTKLDDRREYSRLVFRPDGVHKDDEYNTFVPFRASGFAPIALPNAGLERFKEVALNLVNGVPDHYDYLIKWIALKIQKPWVIPGVCLVFTGEQGVGKSLLWNTLIGKQVIGPQLYVYTDNIYRDLFDTHSEAEMSNVFCLMEETSSAITRQMANSLKAKITAVNARINPKNVRPFQIDTFMSYVLITNDASPVKLENGDRRYCIFNTGSAHIGDAAYWNETAALFENDETAAAVYQFLMSIDLSGFLVTKFPVTEIRSIMLENERSPEEMFLAELATDLEAEEEWNGSNASLYKLYAQWCRKYDMRPKSAIQFGRDLTSFIIKGWVKNYALRGLHGKTVLLKKIRDSMT